MYREISEIKEISEILPKFPKLLKFPKSRSDDDDESIGFSTVDTPSTIKASKTESQ